MKRDAFKLPILPPMPDMRCDEGCRDCCNECVPVSEIEMARVVVYANAHDVTPQEDDWEMCPWYQRGRCAVYEARPVACRTYGHIDHPSQTCTHGYNANVTDALPFIQAMRAKGPTVRFLHEVVGDLDWTRRVQPHVWEHVQSERQQVGLPPLAHVRDTDK